MLTATNKESVQASQALRKLEVPFAFYKQEGLFQTDQAQAVHDLLAAIVDPADADKRSRAWITPFFAVPLEALPDLDELPDSHPLIKRLDGLERASRQTTIRDVVHPDSRRDRRHPSRAVSQGSMSKR